MLLIQDPTTLAWSTAHFPSLSQGPLTSPPIMHTLPWLGCAPQRPSSWWNALPESLLCSPWACPCGHNNPCQLQRHLGLGEGELGSWARSWVSVKKRERLAFIRSTLEVGASLLLLGEILFEWPSAFSFQPKPSPGILHGPGPRTRHPSTL